MYTLDVLLCVNAHVRLPPQAKVAQARMQASEESSKVQRLQRELAELKTALQDAQRQALHRDCDTKGMVTGLHEALEATRATLEAERARGEQRAKVMLVYTLGFPRYCNQRF